MIKKYGMHKVICNDILEESNIGEIDELLFTTWKNQLQKELPSFWESMNMPKNSYNQDDIVSNSQVLS